MSLLPQPTDAPVAEVQPTSPRCYFITGTGRCGTMLLARLLDRAANGVCEHEAVFRHESMVACHARGDWSHYERDIAGPLARRLAELRGSGLILGISSGHCHFAIPRLYERLGAAARFVLVIRKPEDFTRSALARGMFDASHPNYCDQIVPHADEPMARRWERASPLERCLWYWTLVNEHVLASFAVMPESCWRVVRMEDFSPGVLCDLAAFVGLRGISVELAEEVLSSGVNITPGSRSGEVNPNSLPATLGPLDTWTDDEVRLLDLYCGRLRSQWYDALDQGAGRPVDPRGITSP